ncbi:MAG: response regulator transcription factor [Ilumatobacteraceae bacterium]
MSQRVLIVDDEPQIRRALMLNLRVRGYDVDEAESGEQALERIADHPPDIVLLDLGLPGRDGISTLELLRRWSDVPVIVLTARDDDATKVRALDAGADDYITKPFGMAELLSRLAATLRRTPTAITVSPHISTAHFDLNLNTEVARVGQPRSEVRLTSTEWAIVLYLVHRPDRVVSQRELIEAVWGSGDTMGRSLVRVHMYNIRHKLEADPANPEHFLNDHGSGYKFRKAVPPAAPDEPPKGT